MRHLHIIGYWIGSLLGHFLFGASLIIAIALSVGMTFGYFHCVFREKGRFIMHDDMKEDLQSIHKNLGGKI